MGVSPVFKYGSPQTFQVKSDQVVRAGRLVDYVTESSVTKIQEAGLTSVKVWACSLACYTKAFLATGGADVEGTYVWMQFLPFEEADSNPEAKAYIAGVGADKADSFGAQAWQSAALFKQVVDGIVAKSGPNAITRAAILDGLKNTKDFTANGWMGPKDLKGFSSCYVILQVKSGAFARVYPAEKGKFDCDASNVVASTIDPAEEAKKIT